MTTFYTIKQNGVVKHKNRTLVGSVRCTISFVKLPNSFWAKVLATSNYIQNKLPISVMV
jgi:hypothetical protein